MGEEDGGKSKEDAGVMFDVARGGKL